jgi:hypothetical protein
LHNVGSGIARRIAADSNIPSAQARHPGQKNSLTLVFGNDVSDARRIPKASPVYVLLHSK